MSVVLLGAALAFHEPIRHGTAVFLRWPFTLLKACAATLVTLPRLPTLTGENTRLRSELLQRQLEIATLRESLRHTEQADALVHAARGQRLVIASVIASSTIPTQQTVLLDKGERHGLSRDSVILHTAGVVGRVTELHPTICLVMLLTDAESRVAGFVERSRETGLLVGQGRGVCEFTYLDTNADIQEGDRILTAGLGGTFPKGLLLGTVSRVFRDEQAGIAWASVRPAVALSQVEEVACLVTPRAASEKLPDETRRVK